MYKTSVNCFIAQTAASVPVKLVLEKEYTAWLQQQSEVTKRWLQAIDYKGKAGAHIVVANSEGKLEEVILTIKHADDWFSVGDLPTKLPEGNYLLQPQFANANIEQFYLMWGLGAYQYTRYKKAKRKCAKLVVSALDEMVHLTESIYLVRDLINTPAQDCMPQHLAEEAKQLADKFQAKYHEIIGEDLLIQNYPCIYHVGKGSAQAPRLIELTWGDVKHPLVTLVGKGVCFDSGGLDIKPASGMLQMKKDMGGAAHVLGLAYAIMSQQLPVRLRVLIPAVENAISGNSYRPGDVLTSRAGKTIEIGNTDAEGRLILCDALAEAVTEKPELLIDFATLTGAARIAVGTEIAAFFTNKQTLANDVMHHGESQQDPCWQLPLFAAYRSMFDSKIADINNSASSSYAGAITAALFLQEFVPQDQAWIHFDVMAWNVNSKPGKPEGAEAMGLRAMYALLKDKFC